MTMLSLLSAKAGIYISLKLMHLSLIHIFNIDEYYTRYVLAEKTDVEKTTEEILKDAAELHEYLRTYGSLKDQDKPLVVSGILLALDDKFFKPDDLLGDETTTDGQLIYDAIKRRLKASNIGPDARCV